MITFTLFVERFIPKFSDYHFFDCNFYGIKSSFQGGAVYINNIYSNSSFNYCSFIDCRQYYDDICGGLLLYIRNINISSCCFSRCFSKSEGSAFLIEDSNFIYINHSTVYKSPQFNDKSFSTSCKMYSNNTFITNFNSSFNSCIDLNSGFSIQSKNSTGIVIYSTFTNLHDIEKSPFSIKDNLEFTFCNIIHNLYGGTLLYYLNSCNVKLSVCIIMELSNTIIISNFNNSYTKVINCIIDFEPKNIIGSLESTLNVLNFHLFSYKFDYLNTAECKIPIKNYNLYNLYNISQFESSIKLFLYSPILLFL